MRSFPGIPNVIDVRRLRRLPQQFLIKWGLGPTAPAGPGQSPGLPSSGPTPASQFGAIVNHLLQRIEQRRKAIVSNTGSTLLNGGRLVHQGSVKRDQTVSQLLGWRDRGKIAVGQGGWPAQAGFDACDPLLKCLERSRDGQTFFATQILSFQPELRERRFHAPLRNFDFYDDRAIYHDARRKLEVTLDQSAMPITWDATWNRWKHLLGAKVELQGTLVQTSKYWRRNGQWNLVKWETALPSRIRVKIPPSITDQIETARRSYYRFGKFSDALGQIRARIEREPMEREQLRSLCWDLGIPGDFDIAQITWKPDYDQSYYRQLCRRSRRLYLYRDEYIFDTSGGIAVETPQLGHATYLFSKAVSIEAFLAAYVATTKEAVRQNRANVAERLGFLGRVVHGSNPRIWLRTLAARLGEAADSAQVASEGE